MGELTEEKRKELEEKLKEEIPKVEEILKELQKQFNIEILSHNSPMAFFLGNAWVIAFKRAKNSSKLYVIISMSDGRFSIDAGKTVDDYYTNKDGYVYFLREPFKLCKYSDFVRIEDLQHYLQTFFEMF